MESRIGFEALTDDGLARVEQAYVSGLAAYEQGGVNYPCGKSPRTVRRWLRAIRLEIARRDAE